ncbi:hypothetical protein B0H10DRAFT_2059689 [Mycena sp. CBHHK59/15]|nr:hypothetical protein B0H10DRAFT_2059689 [Mycena sp. CBHHK59/15]
MILKAEVEEEKKVKVKAESQAVPFHLESIDPDHKISPPGSVVGQLEQKPLIKAEDVIAEPLLYELKFYANVALKSQTSDYKLLANISPEPGIDDDGPQSNDWEPNVLSLPALQPEIGDDVPQANDQKSERTATSPPQECVEISPGQSLSVHRVKREYTGDALPIDAPAKRPRIFMDAVELPWCRPPPILERARAIESLGPEVEVQVAKLSNVKKEYEMSLESVIYRLNAIGLDPFPISLSNNIKRATVTRDWISKYYGGSPQGSSPPINRRKFKHGMSFRFFDFDFNPNLPRNPGDPGLVYFGLRKAYEWPKTGEHVFVRFAVNKWRYVGQYKISVAQSLTADEWKQQSSAVRVHASDHFSQTQRNQFKNQWCTTIVNGGGGRYSRAVRINIDLNRRLGRAPTAAEKDKAMKSSEKFMNLTPEQIDAGFARGQGSIAVWTMKCIGYNAAFQRELATMPPGWKR